MVLVQLAMTHKLNKTILTTLVLMSMASSVLPWFLTAMLFSDLAKGRFAGFVEDFLFPVLWAVLVLFTIGYGQWERKLWRLFWFSPIAFAGPLFLLWFYMTAKVGGFAP